MAKAIKKTPDDYEVVLTLSKVEAELLRRVLGRIGGHPSGLRRHIDSMSAALDAAGVRSDEYHDAVHGADLSVGQS